MKPSSNPVAKAGSEKDTREDLKAFDALPAKTKTLARLQDEADKTSGPAAVTLQKEIKAAGAAKSRASG